MAHDHAHHASDPDAFYDYLDLETSTLDDYWRQALDTVAAAVADDSARRIVDIGAGNGVGVVGFAQRFLVADVVAIDASDRLLASVEQRARDAGLGDRIRTVLADLDTTWPDELAGVDLIWASMSLHHTSDPAQLLRRLRAATGPGGVLAVAEVGRPLHFFPAEIEAAYPGLEDRVIAAVDHQLRAQLPTLGSAWRPRIEAAGWDVVTEHEIDIAVEPPLASSAVAFGRALTTATITRSDDLLGADDLTALRAVAARLTDPRSTPEFRFHGSRTITVARAS